MAQAAHSEIKHDLPEDAASALEKIAELAKAGMSPDEIAIAILREHRDVADETLAAYAAFKTKQAEIQYPTLTKKP